MIVQHATFLEKADRDIFIDVMKYDDGWEVCDTELLQWVYGPAWQALVDADPNTDAWENSHHFVFSTYRENKWNVWLHQKEV